VGANIKSNIARREELPELVHFLLPYDLLPFGRMQPLGVLDLPVFGQLEGYDFVGIDLGPWPNAEHVKKLSWFHMNLSICAI
jgi:hypothetical protein